MRQLSDLTVGEQARVLQISDQSGLAVRLLEMGVTPGATICRVGAAPLGDPLEFELRGYRLCLRRREAEAVQVESSSSALAET